VGLSGANATTIIVRWFAGHACKHHNKWYTQQPKLLLDFYVMVLFTNLAADSIFDNLGKVTVTLQQATKGLEAKQRYSSTHSRPQR
jgi:hypothetical protein